MMRAEDGWEYEKITLVVGKRLNLDALPWPAPRTGDAVQWSEKTIEIDEKELGFRP